MSRHLLLLGVLTASLGAAEPDVVTFEKDIQPLLEHYCYRCHGEEKQKGELKLSEFSTESSILEHREIWLEVLHQLVEEEMPTKEPLPSRKERQLLINWIDRSVNDIDWSKVRNAGHVTIPRLTKVEYNHTMRDLLGMDLDPGATFTEDGEGRSGFTTDRDALFITPAAMEKYFAAAERALESVIAIEEEPMRVHLESEEMFMTETRETPKKYGEDFLGYSLNRGQMTLYDAVNFPYDGEYEFKVRARADNGRAGGRLRIDDVAKGDIVAPTKEPAVYTFRAYVAKGTRQMAWNIQTPPPPPKDPNARQVDYVKLPADAEAQAAERAKKNAPRWVAVGNEAKAVSAAIATLDEVAEKMQAGYELLAMLGPDGDPAQVAKFRRAATGGEKGLKRSLNSVAKALKENPKKFEQEFRKRNAKQLAVNKQLLDQSNKVVQSDQARKKGKAGPISIDWIEVTGPLRPADAPEKSQVFAVRPGAGLSGEAAARQNLASFLPRAFRREVSEDEQAKFLSLYQKGAAAGLSFGQSMKLALTGALVSPQFLFRHELAPPSAAGAEYKLDDFQLASRLSYFLWSSMPDNELFRLARDKKLSEPDVLRAQVRRMLKDPKASAFAEAFTGQWLGFASVGVSVIPDQKRFSQFDPELAEAMKAETVLSFTRLVREDRSLLELLDSKETFLNERLARHYGIEGVTGANLRPVALTDRNRGGLLGMASVLTATSSPTRTSPVGRGKWVLDTLLGNRIPAPPPDAGALEANAGTIKGKTLREELEQHRANPDCAGCHNKIDPIGFGLENFDAIGRFRTKENGVPIDGSGTIDGKTFDGPIELKEYLLSERREEFFRNVTEKTLAYALGRVLQFYDEGPVREILATLEKQGYGAGRLIEEVVLSYPFLYQNPNAPETTGANHP